MSDILYPESKPFNEGTLPVSGIHTLSYKEYGNKDGIPIVYLHGGPGAGSGPHFHRFFDPDTFHIIIYDQRGAGESKPAADIRDNTPDLLVEDLEKLKNHLGIDQWHVYGGSWGSTLALLYAEEYPASVKSLTLRGIFMLRQKDIDLFYRAAEMFLPEETRKFREFLPEAERGNVVESYYKRLTDPDPAIHFPAAQAWAYYEAVSCYLSPPPEAELRDPDEVALNIARLELHFFRNGRLTPDDRILKNVDKIRHIPTLVVQGSYDIVCPPEIAYDLHQVFPEAHMQMTIAGHGATEPANMKALVEATDRIRDSGSPVPRKKAPPSPPASKPSVP
ncbi:MAG: prolyl aminopeptidase [Proteobacteria bacterium]|nr:prolyl aminopeptidase [Pseudomonadota bacterium]